MSGITRRNFLKSSAAAAGTALAVNRLPRAHAKSAVTVAPAKLNQLRYGQVQLLDGPMLEQFERNHRFFLAMDEDGLLKPFRERAGLPAPGPVMGGWYNDSPDFDPGKNMTGYVPGHTFGQYVSGLARAYAITGDAATRDKVHRLVAGFAPAVTGKFYVDYPLPAYTFDKSSIGLLDAYAFAGDPIALRVLGHATDAVLPHLPAGAETRDQACARPHKNASYCWDETYTLPENFYIAYQRSSERRYRLLAERFLQDRDYFGPLARGENVLPGLHAYSHMNALASAMQAWYVDGSEMHRQAAENGFEFIRTTQSFATGGWGPDEGFRKPGSGDLGESLEKTHSSFETPCGAYGHFKVARYLMRASADSRYGDSMERILYNTILGAKPLLADGTSFYYSDYNNLASKFYHQDKWPCCSGTFPQITADYGISSYFQSQQGIYVNLYVPSTVSWVQQGARCSLTQRTEYPYRPETSLELKIDRPRAFAIYLRVPEWAGAGTRAAINGKVIEGTLTPGSFAPIERVWNDGDRVEFFIETPLHLQPVDTQHPGQVALLQGPLCLFAVNNLSEQVRTKDLLTARQVTAGASDWVTGAGRTLRSYPAIRDEKYRLYLPLAT